LSPLIPSNSEEADFLLSSKAIFDSLFAMYWAFSRSFIYCVTT
jgi:hypothetical protein